ANSSYIDQRRLRVDMSKTAKAAGLKSWRVGPAAAPNELASADRSRQSRFKSLERPALRVVVGRKNHYGSRSRRGTEVAALFYSLCESAKIAGVEPRAYLLRATHAALETPGTVTLPHSQIDTTPTPCQRLSRPAPFWR
ncbi:MAG: hypothetical protein M3O15_02035, partial [Acidobacteriota bacterium]|nr:hypothetical protein [Acidobacteriota bacterium]